MSGNGIIYVNVDYVRELLSKLPREDALLAAESFMLTAADDRGRITFRDLYQEVRDRA